MVEVDIDGRKVEVPEGSMLMEADNLRRAGEDFASEGRGTLTIAATHSQARYALPPAVRAVYRLMADEFRGSIARPKRWRGQLATACRHRHGQHGARGAVHALERPGQHERRLPEAAAARRVHR